VDEQHIDQRASPYEAWAYTEEAMNSLRRIESLVAKHVNDQAGAVKRMERDVKFIRTWAHWCASAALMFLGLVVYHYFFR
jgi:hypothetical protein